MDKAFLDASLRTASDNYIWTLYFFNSHKQRNAGYVYDSHKVRFTNNANLLSYTSQLINAVSRFQLDPIDQVEEYNGLNTKCSCDRLCVNDVVISTNFTSFRNSLATATDAVANHSYKGYVLDGQPGQGVDGAAITFLKFANPTAKLKSKGSVYFKKTADNSLDDITEEFYRLYLTVDAVLINDQLYCFTHAFEKIFDVEQTLHKVKEQAIATIIDAGFIANRDAFAEHAKSTNARSFITLNSTRIQRLIDEANRSSIAADYNVSLNAESLFDIAGPEQAGRLLKYLCYKTVKDSETSEILEANNITRLNVTET